MVSSRGGGEARHGARRNTRRDTTAPPVTSSAEALFANHQAACVHAAHGNAPRPSCLWPCLPRAQQPGLPACLAKHTPTATRPRRWQRRPLRHCRISAFQQHEMCAALSPTCSAVTQPSWRAGGVMGSAAGSHTRTVPSSEAVTATPPRAVSAMPRTSPLWPGRAAVRAPVVASHTMHCRSPGVEWIGVQAVRVAQEQRAGRPGTRACWSLFGLVRHRACSSGLERACPPICTPRMHPMPASTTTSINNTHTRPALATQLCPPCPASYRT